MTPDASSQLIQRCLLYILAVYPEKPKCYLETGICHVTEDSAVVL